MLQNGDTELSFHAMLFASATATAQCILVRDLTRDGWIKEFIKWK